MKAIYPGSFDPPTNGHLDIIKRASKLCDYLVVGVLKNPDKKPLFSDDEKIFMLKELTKDMPNVEVSGFSGLLVDFCEKTKCNIIIRGLRAITDFEYEFQTALINKTMNNDIETLFMPTDTNNLWLSSSIVKTIAMFDGKYDSMVPSLVKKHLKEKYNIQKEHTYDE